MFYNTGPKSLPQRECLKGAPLGLALGLLANIKPGCKSLQCSNTLAYFSLFVSEAAFNTGKPLLPSLMFASKTRTYSSGAPGPTLKL